MTKCSGAAVRLKMEKHGSRAKIEGENWAVLIKYLHTHSFGTKTAHEQGEAREDHVSQASHRFSSRLGILPKGVDRPLLLPHTVLGRPRSIRPLSPITLPVCRAGVSI